MPDIEDLRERAKELECLYRVHAIASDRERAPQNVFLQVLEVIPSGWRRPQATGARIDYLGRHYVGPGFCGEGASLVRPVSVWDTRVGSLTVSYVGDQEDGAFLEGEVVLLESIAARLGEYLEWKQTELLERRPQRADTHWRWRQHYAEAIARRIDTDAFEIEGLYVGGSTEMGAAGPGSDIDLYVWSSADGAAKERLGVWLDGWSCCLAEVAERHTGYAFPSGVVDLHWLEAAPDRRQLVELRTLFTRRTD